MASIWYGVDPIREMYVANSCYIYCLNNPIIFIDPNGKKVTTQHPQQHELVNRTR